MGPTEKEKLEKAVSTLVDAMHELKELEASREKAIAWTHLETALLFLKKLHGH